MNNNDIARYVLGAIVVIGFSVVAVAWMYTPVRVENNSIQMLIVGALCTGYGGVLTYFFSRKE